ncbi:hypothetical protein Pfo_028868 [Paulownia fortunei]|nr:hypothetical protein Pfo_028868 [Paulownia fortunei]
MAGTAENRTRIMWCMRLHSAFRTALACAILGGATLYGPKFIVNQIKFAAFSYFTVVLIVSDATLGDTLRGCWHAFYATAQVVPLAMLGRWLVDPGARAGLPVGMAALVVAVASFLVVLPESTHLTAKRIALGQIVLACTEAVISSDDTSYGFMHPLHIAASTAMGALASVLALLLPFPLLARYKVEKLCQVYAENASERMNIYLKAFKAQDYQTKTELVLQAKPVGETGTKLLQSIRTLQEGMPWERPWSRYSKHCLVGPGDRLQSMELSMRAIEYSLVSSRAFPVQIVDQEQLSNVLHGVSSQLQQRIEQARHFLPFNSMKAPETRGEFMEKLSLPLESIVPIHKYEWVCFFFSCIDMLLNDSVDDGVFPKELQTQREKTEFGIIQRFKTWILKLTSSERLESAFKCSISLGLAVLLGLILEKENGCWASLTIAISFATGRQAIFTIANARAQGTAIGSVYGVICCFLFHYAEVRLLALLPWIIFSSFLRHSRMYGQTGGMSAAIGASLILGRKNYGPPNEFAIARLTAVFIGLSCFILVELFLHPTRAATLAKRHMCLTLRSLQDCVKETGSYSGQTNQAVSKFLEVREKQRNLESLVRDLRKSVADADSEPDFWYLPFHTSCYQKLAGSLSNVVHMLYVVIYNLEILSELPESGTVRKEFLEQLNNELELFQENVNSLLKYLEKVSLIKSPALSQAPTEEKFTDLEAGKLKNREKLNALITEDEEARWTTEEKGSEDEKQLRERMVRCLGATRFCISSLRKEIDEVEICIKEIVRWENHTSQ